MPPELSNTARLRKGALLWSAAFGLSLTVLGLIFFLPSPEPCYQCHQLSYWLDRLPARLVFANGYSIALPGSYATLAEAQADQERLGEEVSKARKAVRTLGTQCLPMILRRLQTRDPSALRQMWTGWGFRFHLLKRSSPIVLSAQFLRGQALTGLLELGPDAKGAIPDLVTLAHHSDPGVKTAARHALEQIAPEEFKRLGHE